MKKNYKYLFMFIFLILPFIYVKNVKADYKAVVENKDGATCNIYKGNLRNSGFCYYTDKNLNSIVDHVLWLDNLDEVTVLTDHEKVPTNDPALCSDYYVYTSYRSTNYGLKYGYYCNAYLKPLDLDEEDEEINKLKQEFKDLGFPDSYINKLVRLKEMHPTWTFKAIKTNLNWKDAVEAESAIGVSLIQGNKECEGYYSTLGGSYDYKKDEFFVKEGTNWYAANSDVVAYFMDPRNFLNDMNIFQFSTLESNPSLQTIDAVNEVLKGNFLLSNSEDFINAENLSGVNSVYLAALAVQEVGKGTQATSGEGFYYSESNKKYPSLRGKWIDAGFYNVYNIGAGTDTKPAQNSVVYAMGGENKNDTSYSRPWTSLSLAITGGAEFISANYLKKGQYTIYSKKFNVHPIGWNLYSNQYQTNIQGAYSEGQKIYNAYYKLNILDQAFVFTIPVYENMPDETELPKKGNPNNYLSSLSVKVNGEELSINGFNGDKTDYTLYVPYSASKVTINATSVKNKASISNIGEKTLNVGDNKFDIVVTAQNGSVRIYTLNIIRNENESKEPTVNDIVDNLGVKCDGVYFSGIDLSLEVATLENKVKSINPNAIVEIKNNSEKEDDVKTFATGDIVSITSAGETKSFKVIIYGDTNGDAKINSLDILRVQKHILNAIKLTDEYEKAANVSRKSSVEVSSLIKIQKYILGEGSIEQ